MSRWATSTFTNGTGGCAGWSASPEFPGCGGSPAVFPIFLSYSLMIYPMKHYYQRQYDAIE